VGRPLALAWDGSPAGVGDPPQTRRSLTASPLPARGVVQLAFDASRSGARARLEIFDLSGRRLATPFSGSVGSGRHTRSWNRTDDRGRRVASGVYVARLELDDAIRTCRIVLVD
jgi:hypothetical protein